MEVGAAMLTPRNMAEEQQWRPLAIVAGTRGGAPALFPARARTWLVFPGWVAGFGGYRALGASGWGLGCLGGLERGGSGVEVGRRRFGPKERP